MKSELKEIEDALYDADRAIDDARRAISDIKANTTATELPIAVAQALAFIAAEALPWEGM